MEMLVLVIFSGAVVLASMGLIALLFAEIFKSKRQSEGFTRQGAGPSAAGVTAEERASLTSSGTSENWLARESSLFRRKPASSAAENNPPPQHR